MTYTKAPCDKCQKIHRTRGLVLFKGQLLCYSCRPNIPMNMGRTGYTLEQALDRTYTIGCTWSKKGFPRAMKAFPNILAGKKVKLVLIE